MPGTVSVTVKVWPDIMTSGEFAGLAPEGMLVHTTSCGAPLWLSWSEKVTAVPGAIVALAGEKSSDWSAPTFCGITMVKLPAELVDGADVEVIVVEVVVLVDVLGAVVLLVEVEVVLVGVLLDVVVDVVDV